MVNHVAICIYSYRDMLDRWRMWFYRMEFDNCYSTRLVKPQLNTGGGIISGASPAGLSNTPSKDTALQNTPRLLSPVTSVRGIGLPSAASQVCLKKENNYFK